MSLNPEQLARRSKGVGSSDAAAAAGLNPYYSRIELWMEKRGESPPFLGSEATKWGKLLEPAVRQEYAEQTGRVVRLPLETLVHEKHPVLVCHPDGVTDDGRLYEGKCSRFGDDFGEPGSDQVPEHYLLQCQHGMMVTGLKVADLAVLVGGNDFRLYEIRADEGLQAALLDAELEFWRCVETGTRPPIDYSAPGIVEVMKKLYPGTNGQKIMATEAICVARAALEAAKALGKSAEMAEAEAKAELLDFMGDASVLVFPDRKAYRRQKVDRISYIVPATSYIDARFVKY